MPIRNPTVHRQILDEVLLQNMYDVANSWDLRADGEYQRSTMPAGEAGPPHNAHSYFLTHESLSGKGGGVHIPARPHRQRESDL